MKLIKGRKIIMNLDVAKESDLRGVWRAGNAHSGDGKDYNSMGRKGARLVGTFCGPSEVYPSDEAAVAARN
jgi:hypothetical protein